MNAILGILWSALLLGGAWLPHLVFSLATPTIRVREEDGAVRIALWDAEAAFWLLYASAALAFVGWAFFSATPALLCLALPLTARRRIRVGPTGLQDQRRVLLIPWWSRTCDGTVWVAVDGWGDELDPTALELGCGDVEPIQLCWPLGPGQRAVAERLRESIEDGIRDLRHAV